MTAMRLAFRTPPGQNFFFGYYDKSPLNASNTRLLAQRSEFIDHMPTLGDVIEIGYFDFPAGGAFHVVTRTSAWNWQQGCMLQWQGPDFDRAIIYNDLRDGTFVSVVRSIDDGAERVLPMPVYTVTSDAKWGLCIDYERHFWYRAGYNYQGPPNRDKKRPIAPEDGIWRMSLENGAVTKIISMTDILARSPLSSMVDCVHYLEHLMINPSNSRFCFLHRWRNVDGGIFTRLFSANLDGTDMRLVSESGRMSHFCWRDDDWILGFGGRATTLNRLRRYRQATKYLIKPLLPLYHRLIPHGGGVSQIVTGDGYLLFSDRTGEVIRVEHEALREDGHPTFRPGGRHLFVSDSYPDEKGDCRLFLFDLATMRFVAHDVIASDPAFRATGHRCDLHPKWSHDGRFVSIDRVTGAERSVEVFEIGDGL